VRIFALDPGVRAGFAEGESGTIPLSGAVRLKKQSEPIEKAAEQLGCFLRDRWSGPMGMPDLLCIEHWMQPGAQKNAAAAISSLLLAGAARAMAGVYGIRVEEPWAQTVRKHFCGKARLDDRGETNRMVLNRAIALGYVPRDCTDWDRANACALFDYAAATYGRVAPKSLVMFGGTA
jgi:hypothetical protein